MARKIVGTEIHEEAPVKTYDKFFAGKALEKAKQRLESLKRSRDEYDKEIARMEAEVAEWEGLIPQLPDPQPAPAPEPAPVDPTN